MSFGSKLKRLLSWNQILKGFFAWKVSKYGVFSGPYFLVFELNTEIYFVNRAVFIQYIFAILLLLLKESTFGTRKNAQWLFSLLKFSSFKIIEFSILRRHPEFYKLILIDVWWRTLSKQCTSNFANEFHSYNFEPLLLVLIIQNAQMIVSLCCVL